MRIVATVSCLFVAVPVMADNVRLAIAANFTAAGEQLIQQFEKTTGHSVKASYGSTGKLFAQINNGAPYDVLLSADEATVIKLEALALAVAGSRFTYAHGTLMLWSAKANMFNNPEHYLQAAQYAHLAIANPNTAPYGAAAQQVLQQLGVWATVQNKLVQGDSIAQAFQFVATENAEAGFVARSQVLAWKHSGSSWEIPQHYYQPIIQQAALLQPGKNHPAAQAFLNYLQTAAAKKIIRDFGYGVDE